MCGLAGLVAFDPERAISRPTLEKMLARIAHRGPDGQGIYLTPQQTAGPKAALAHCRLAVLDPDPRSNQPFTDGKRWLVFNGEIYNFRNLRGEISNHKWITEGDTEVLLAAYSQWKENCVDHLNGMYAFAVWDSMAECVLLARDRMGQKPLFYALDRGEKGLRAVAFASEIGALLPVEWIDKELDHDALEEYLRWGYVSPPRTLYRGIQQLGPAETLLLSADGIASRIKYFDPDFPPRSRPKIEDPVGDTRLLVRQAVQRQLVSDVPLGCFLSGGIDSSVIAAAMVASGQPTKTFAIGFDEKEYDETPYAAEVAQRLGTEHRQFVVRPDAASDLPKLAAAFGEPLADSSALPMHYLSRETRKHVTVALSGDGGDELFGGYDRYRAIRFNPRAFRLLAPMIRAIPGTHPKSKAARLKRLMESSHLPEDQRYAEYVCLMDESLLIALLAQPPQHLPGIEHDFRLMRKIKGVFESALAVDRRTYLPGDVLAKVDRCSMLHALEVRSPFLDHELVRFAASLSEAELLQGGKKGLLRRAFGDELPARVFSRKKMGFAVPIGAWLRSTLRPMLNDLLFAADSFASRHFHRDTIEQMIREHQDQTRDHSQRLYALLMLELWQRNCVMQ